MIRKSVWPAMAFAALLVTACPATAHPLGNFTINHLTRLSIGAKNVSLRYVLDMAEIPTYQELRAGGGDGSLSRKHLLRWGDATAEAVLAQLDLRVDGAAAPLVLDGVRVSTRRGAGGLPTLYLSLDAHTPALSKTHLRNVAYRDRSYAGRLGWRDVVVSPAAEPTRELTSYPSALLASPRSTTGVDVAFSARGPTVRALSDESGDAGPAAPLGGALTRSNQLSDMLARGTGDWAFVLLTFAVAIVLGALHALEPGHGKTLLAISLVGARATVKQATILASALTTAHTAGVLALGVAISALKGYFVPETIYPWITLLSGLAIAIIGARAVARQVAARQPHVHDHGHGNVRVTSLDQSDLEHARMHALPGTAPLKFGATVWAAMSGAVAPCPAALVVLLAAVALNQVAYGILVVVAFSFGLAATLTGLGIAVVRGAAWLQSRPQFDRFVTYGPLVSAVVISGIGAIMVGQGFVQSGATAPRLLISGLVALAIAGYSYSHSLTHHRLERA